MFAFMKITDVIGREILDSRGNPTVEVQITVENTVSKRRYAGMASVPSGASTGRFEAIELRDGEERYLGLGVKRAIDNIEQKIKPILLGKNVLEQTKIDRLLLSADGTDNKSNLGANAMLGVSLACARAAANALHIPLYRYLGGSHAYLLPTPMMNIMNGGKHATNTVDFQEFMIMPVSSCCFSEGLRMCAEVYHKLKQILVHKGFSTGVGDEGGFAPNLRDAREVLDQIMEAIRAANYKPGEDFRIALDVASSELYDETDGMYHFPGENKLRDASEMVSYYEQLIQDYPICSIEDGLAEDDWEGWKMMTERLGHIVQLVGDDLFVTNPKRLDAGIKLGVANAVLVKVNQIGTVTEAMDTIERAQKAGYKAVISHRSGETEDAFIADLSVAVNAGQIKTGAPCRSERVAKYNQLLRIEEDLRKEY
ncbi:MAG: phosphopyruvate hydratase [Lachnospiraceae bacterium]